MVRTTRRLCDRMWDQICNTNSGNDTNLARHISQLQYSVSQRSNHWKNQLPCPRWIFSILCKREVYWIFKLDTGIPRGLNYEWNVTHYYELSLHLFVLFSSFLSFLPLPTSPFLTSQNSFLFYFPCAFLTDWIMPIWKRFCIITRIIFFRVFLSGFLISNSIKHR